MFQRRFGRLSGRKPPAALPSRLVGTLSACLPAFLLCLPAWLSCLAPATRQQAARQPATPCLAGRENRLTSQNRLHSGYILAGQVNRLISQNRLDGGWMDLPWLMPAAFECPSLLAIRAAIAPLTHGFQIRL